MCFGWIYKLQNLRRHCRDTCPSKVTLSIVSLESQVVSKLNWLNTMQLKTNISNLLLTKKWRLETSSRVFYDFDKVLWIPYILYVCTFLISFSGWFRKTCISYYASCKRLKFWHIYIDICKYGKTLVIRKWRIWNIWKNYSAPIKNILNFLFTRWSHIIIKQEKPLVWLNLWLIYL